ncbi:MAG: type I methionyl aminopeptidase [Patescibacteria group bacterium]|nr:type I methionyl aminopeptidase [Patescibacteria group bacterium]
MEILRSPREIGLMRKAGLLVWEAHRIAGAMVRPGVTTGEIDQAVESFFREQGAVPLFKNVPNSNKKGPPFPAVTCISVNEEVVHGIPGPRRLVEGDIVSIDTGCKLDGWCGDAASTYPCGPLCPEVRCLLDVTRDVLHLAIDQMARCRWWSEVATQMERFVGRHGYSVVEAFVGHGIGRDMHEDPQVPNYFGRQIRRSADFRLQPGLVIAIEPMVNLGRKAVRQLADQWTQVTRDGKPSAHYEHTVAMTAEGPVILTAGPNGETWQ